MKATWQLGILITGMFLESGVHPALAQKSFRETFSSRNSSMSKQQPALITPLVAPDPRIVQYAKLSLASQYTPTGTHTMNYGNSRGFGLIDGNRFEFDFVPPPYIQHNSEAIDGFGDIATLVKYRIASGDAHHGNYALTAILNRTFATGSHKNGAATGSFGPALAGAKAFGRMDVISSLGGTLPTDKVSTQGRCMVWNSVFQAHLNRPLLAGSRKQLHLLLWR